jgi:hypothetical protein
MKLWQNLLVWAATPFVIVIWIAAVMFPVIATLVILVVGLIVAGVRALWDDHVGRAAVPWDYDAAYPPVPRHDHLW